MTTRISERDLENVCKRINKATGNQVEPVTRNADNTLSWSIGTYTLSAAYGGWKLERIENEAGGVRTISSGGYIPKRELYNQMQAFLSGIEAANN